MTRVNVKEEKLKDKDLLKLLKKNGWRVERIQGSHHILKNNGRSFVC
ncbi:MAG: type II toxin-antitoxin system HicA family toxin [Hespellia sp.]|nr:type II toxin-antitoxin system HicA family toxin [Hespellia sp.]